MNSPKIAILPKMVAHVYLVRYMNHLQPVVAWLATPWGNLVSLKYAHNSAHHDPRRWNISLFAVIKSLPNENNKLKHPLSHRIQCDFPVLFEQIRIWTNKVLLYMRQFKKPLTFVVIEIFMCTFAYL